MTCDRSVVFSGFFGFPTNKTDCHNITEILLKVELNTIKQTNKTTYTRIYFHYPYIPCTSLDWKNPVQIRIQINKSTQAQSNRIVLDIAHHRLCKHADVLGRKFSRFVSNIYLRQYQCISYLYSDNNRIYNLFTYPVS